MSHPEFDLEAGLIYLNHAGVGPWPKRTSEAICRFAEENRQRGAADYPRWLTVEKRLRENLRRLINAPSSDDIALVKNTSEALSLVAYGLPWKEGDNIVTSTEEFPSNRIPWESLQAQGVELREAELDSGSDPEAALFELVDRRTRLITISSVQYASGRRMDLERIGDFCRRQGILFCVDAIQSVGALRTDVQAWQADFVMADGHKWLVAPEGLGLFYTTPESRERLRLTQFGWHMVENAGDYECRDWHPATSARRFECGSPNMLGIHGLEASTALLLQEGMDQVEARVLANAAWLIQVIGREPNLECLTPPERHGGIVTFRPLSIPPTALFEHLRRHRVVCALRGGGIRFSAHFYNDTENLKKTMALITTSSPKA